MDYGINFVGCDHGVISNVYDEFLQLIIQKTVNIQKTDDITKD